MRPRLYRKLPVTIEAMEYTGTQESGRSIARWVQSGGGYAYASGPEMVAGQPSFVMYVDTLEGQMRATPGDFIIKGVSGEFYPCKPDIFWKTYEAIESR